MYVWNGSVSYTDDDEDFLSGNGKEITGIVVMRFSQEEFLDLLVKLSKVDPDYANKNIVKEFYNANYGNCCGIEYHSEKKNEVCVNCGKDVYLT